MRGLKLVRAEVKRKEVEAGVCGTGAERTRLFFALRWG